jgi:hypothetical protein
MIRERDEIPVIMREMNTILDAPSGDDGVYSLSRRDALDP